MADRDAARAAFRQMVDESLGELHKPGMSAETLYLAYTFFSDQVSIASLDALCNFRAHDYARRRAVEICTASQMKES